ncbi:MAG: hypothetical protein AMJ88_13945 [Anaerolineae bacterium SM23_ 63]|nr:MAG: hypothetical protein AMJ88_13945 [Anaerolineae bacterium SM23_ 63]HEY45596.1 YfhO family protein [Anaerolineae bacterium]
MKDWLKNFEERIIQISHEAIDAIFLPANASLSRWQRTIQWSWIFALLLIGLVMWVYFLDGGRIQFEIHDWPKEWQYYTILKQALTDKTIPLHTNPNPNAPERFLSIPETVLSPQILSLSFLEPGQFVLLNALLLFSIGFLGLLLIKRRYNLSPITFGVLFLLFSFNGHIVSHVSVGHSMWFGYYLLPFFMLQLFRLIDHDYDHKWPLVMGLILFGITLQGSIHFYVWCVMLLLILLVILRPHRIPILKSLIASALLAAHRILPAALVFAENKRRFFPGYINFTDILSALVKDVSPYEAISGRLVGWWELDHYVSLVGLLFILLFGFYPLFDPNHEEKSSSKFLPLYIPMIIMMILSVSYLYQPIHSLPIPLVGLERVPSRFLIMSVVGVIFIAAISAQGWLSTRVQSITKRFISLTFFIIMGHDILRHVRIWRVDNFARALPDPDRVFVSDIQILNQPDPTYVWIIGISTAVTVITIIYTVIRFIRWRKILSD